MSLGTGTFDVHQHFFPPAFLEALRRRTSPPRIVGGELEIAEGRFPFDPGEHDLGKRLAALDEQGTDVGVLSLQQTIGHELLPHDEREELVATWEAGILEVVAASGGRFVALAAGPTRLGFVGSGVGSEALDDPDSFRAVAESIRDHGGFVFVHPSGGSLPADVPAWWGPLAVYTAQMQASYLDWLARGQQRWPDLAIVFSILAGGGPFQLERLGSRGIDVRSVLHTNVFFDTASYGRRALELCVETFGVEQIVYGTDLPVVDPEPTLRALQGFGESVEHLVRCVNPSRLMA